MHSRTPKNLRQWGVRQPAFSFLLAFSLLFTISLSSACSSRSSRSSSSDDDQGEAPTLAAIPDDVVLNHEWAYQLNVEDAVIVLPISGSSTLQIEGVLASADGRRELWYTDAASGLRERVAQAGWLLPPVAAVNEAGQVMLCYDELTGVSTDFTEGAMPDPRAGMTLLCRVRDENGWGTPEELGDEFVAPWVSDILVSSTGTFAVDYYVDDGVFMPHGYVDDGVFQPTHGTYRQTQQGRQFLPRQQLEPAMTDFQRVDEGLIIPP